MTLNPKVLVEGYLKRSSELDSKIAAIDKELKPLLKILDQRQQLEARLEDLTNQIAEGEQRIEVLRSLFFDAQFKELWDEQNEIQEQRHTLNQMVKGLEEEKESAQAELDSLPIPSEELAMLKARADMLAAPAWEGFLHELKNALIDSYSTQNGKINGLQFAAIPTNHFTQAQYDEQRSAIDEGYAGQLELNEYKMRAEQERQQAEQARWKRSLRHPAPRKQEPRVMSSAEVEAE